MFARAQATSITESVLDGAKLAEIRVFQFASRRRRRERGVRRSVIAKPRRRRRSVGRSTDGGGSVTVGSSADIGERVKCRTDTSRFRYILFVWAVRADIAGRERGKEKEKDREKEK